MKNKTTFTGLLFILAGIGLLLNKLGYFQEIRLLNLFLSIILLYISLKNIRGRNFGGVLFPLAFIGILFSKELGIEAITPWTILGVAALGSIGLSLIFKPKYFYSNNFEFDGEATDKMHMEEDGTAFMSVKFSSAVRYLKLEDFKNATAISRFGDLKIYFEGSRIHDEAILNVDIKFGSITLFIPKEWEVVNNVDILFGDFKIMGHNLEPSDEKLIIKGDVKFGDIKLIYI